VLCYDIQENVGDSNAKGFHLKFQQEVEVLSLHIQTGTDKDG
jgi:D-3-phosphoglycerate dehydrogenase